MVPDMRGRVLSLFPRIDDGHFRGRLTVLISLNVSFSSSLSARMIQRGFACSPSRSCSLAVARHKLSCFNDPITCFFTDLKGYVEEVLLASLKPKFYCAVTLGLQLLGIFHVWSGLLNFVAQMLGTNSAWSCHLHFVVF